MAADLPTHLLRGFVALAETGSLAGAAERVGRSESALSLQMTRLERMTGATLFEGSGRSLALTPSGRLLLGHARAVLVRVDLAREELASAEREGPARLGLVQDFAGGFLVDVLGRLAERWPEASIEVRVDGSAALLDALGAGRIDVAVAARCAGGPRANRIEPMAWSGEPRLASAEVLALLSIAPPCPFLKAATAALAEAGRPWRMALATPGLDGLRAAAAAGLGIGCRTAASAAGAAPTLGAEHGLPSLPEMTWSLRRRPGLRSAAAALGDIVAERLTGDAS